MSQAPSPPLTVRVPASTSNMGPGFDLLGLALSLPLEVELVSFSSGVEHVFAERAGEARDWPEGPENLLFRAFDLGLTEFGAPFRAMRVRARSDIPMQRGLGSSGAAVAAGLLLAAEIAGATSEIDRMRLLRLGNEIEGHPDNTTASLLGGCTLALPCTQSVEVVRHRVHSTIGFAVAWPASPISTRAAREVLPEAVLFSDAVENPRRLAMLLEGLRRGDGRLLRLGEEDRLHVRHRLPMIPGGEAAIAAARDAGAWLATVSGSGSALIALGPKDRIGDIRDALIAPLDEADGPASGRIVEAVNIAPRVQSGALERFL